MISRFYLKIGRATLALAMLASLTGCKELANPAQAYNLCMKRTVERLNRRTERVSRSDLLLDINLKDADQYCGQIKIECEGETKTRACMKYLRKYSH